MANRKFVCLPLTREVPSAARRWERQYAFAFKILSLSQLALTAPSSEGAFGLLGLISALQSGRRGRRPLQSIAAILHLQ